MKKIVLCILTLVMMLSCGITVFATENSTDETEFTIDISDLIEMKGKGYVRVSVHTPLGFSGTVIVELEASDGTTKTFEIRRSSDWFDGCWFKEGTCKVKKAYVFDTDAFTAEADVSSVNIDHDVRSEINIQVLENPDAPEWNATWTPPATDASQATSPEQITEPATISETTATERETTPVETEPENSSESSKAFPTSVLILSALAIIVVIFCIKRIPNENKK